MCFFVESSISGSQKKTKKKKKKVKVQRLQNALFQQWKPNWNFGIWILNVEFYFYENGILKDIYENGISEILILGLDPIWNSNLAVTPFQGICYMYWDLGISSHPCHLNLIDRCARLTANISWYQWQTNGAQEGQRNWHHHQPWICQVNLLRALHLLLLTPWLLSLNTYMSWTFYRWSTCK